MIGVDVEHINAAPFGRSVATGMSPNHTVSWISLPLESYSPTRCPASSYMNRSGVAIAPPDFFMRCPSAL